MICVDVGSGYNPKSGYLTCDSSSYCDFHSIEEIPNNVDRFHIRNVLHHIKDLDNFVDKIKTKSYKNTIIEVIDCVEDHYKSNIFLDKLYYRYIFNRSDIFIQETYRDLEQYFIKNGFILKNKHIKNEKLILKFKLCQKKSKNN